MKKWLFFSVILIPSSLWAGTVSIMPAYTVSVGMPSATTTEFGYPSGGGSFTPSAPQHAFISPIAGTIDDFHIITTSPGGAGKSYVFTFFKNGVATALSTGPVNTA